MPDISAITGAKASASVQFMDAGGDIARAGITSNVPITGGQTTALASALGNASNAAVIGYNVSADVTDNPAQRVVLDEAYASVTTKAVFIFQNVNRLTRKVELPAPDASIFGPDGVTVDPANTLVAAIVAATKTIIDATVDPAEPFYLARGFKSGRTRKVRGGRLKPAIAEPGVGVLPGDAPAIGP